MNNHQEHSKLSAAAVSSCFLLEFKSQINYVGICLSLLKWKCHFPNRVLFYDCIANGLFTLLPRNGLIKGLTLKKWLKFT